MLAGLTLPEILTLVAILVAAGVVSGLFAGLFGVGGGAILVPVLYELFRVAGVPEEVRMPLCVGTSLAIIIPTSIRSFNAHRARGKGFDSVDQGVACVDVDTGIAVGQGGFRLIRHEKCRGVCNNCWDFGGTPCILR